VCAVGRVETVNRLKTAIDNNDPTGIQDAVGLPSPSLPPPPCRTPPSPLPRLCRFVPSLVWSPCAHSKFECKWVVMLLCCIGCLLTRCVSWVCLVYVGWQTISSAWTTVTRSPARFRGK